MLKRSFLVGGVIVGMVTAAASTAALAQSAAGSDAYKPLGLRAGAFTLFPALSLAETYDDNIFATGSTRSDDFVTTLAPAIRARSDWSQHSLNFNAGAEVGRYAKSGGEDYEDFNVGADGRVDITRQTQLTAGLSFADEHEDRSSPNDVNGRTPTEYDLINGNLGLTHKFNRVSVGLSGGASDYDYDDVGTSAGTTINNDDRDRREYVASLRLGYDIQESYEAFVRGNWNNREYDSAVDDGGVNRDSDGHGVDAGIKIDLTGVTQAEFFGGWYTQNYSDATLKDPDGTNFGARVYWTPTPLTSVRINVTRAVSETTTAGSSSTVDTTGGVKVEHELRRNILLNAGISYTDSDYQGGTRNDDLIDTGVGANYLLNRNFGVEAAYRYRINDSNDTSQGWVRNQITIRLNAQL